MNELAKEWREKATASRQEAARIYLTVKMHTEAENNCLIRAEVWEQCAAAITHAEPPQAEVPNAAEETCRNLLRAALTTTAPPAEPPAGDDPDPATMPGWIQDAAEEIVATSQLRVRHVAWSIHRWWNRRPQAEPRSIPTDAICLFKDGTKWCAVTADFVNVQESPAGFGDTIMDAIEDLQTGKPTMKAPPTEPAAGRELPVPLCENALVGIVARSMNDAKIPRQERDYVLDKIIPLLIEYGKIYYGRDMISRLQSQPAAASTVKLQPRRIAVDDDSNQALLDENAKLRAEVERLKAELGDDVSWLSVPTCEIPLGQTKLESELEAVRAAKERAEAALTAERERAERLQARLLTAAGDDLCRLSQEEIKAMSLGSVPIPPKEEFLASCERFHAQVAKESGVNTNCLTLAQLIAENQKLESALTAERELAEAALRDVRPIISKAWSLSPLESTTAMLLHTDLGKIDEALAAKGGDDGTK